MHHDSQLAKQAQHYASVNRTNQQQPLPLGTTSQIELQPSWEADLFGGNRATSAAARARLQGARPPEGRS